MLRDKIVDIIYGKLDKPQQAEGITDQILALIEGELEKYAVLQKCPHVKDPFKWMEGWLRVYEAKHPETSAKDIMEWINEQPMTSGG